MCGVKFWDIQDTVLNMAAEILKIRSEGST